MIGSRSTKSSIAWAISAGASASSVRRRPSRVLPPNLRLDLLDLVADGLPLQAFVLQQRLEFLALPGELLVLALDLELFQPAQRAQPHVEDRLGLQVGEPERPDHLGLGLVLLADDLDQPVEVEIGDQVAVEDLQPPLDLGQAEGRAAHQHLAAMVEEGLQCLAQVHDPGRVVLVEDVEVEREADLEVGLPEELLHQELGRHIAGPGIEHDTHVLGELVAHVFEDRQLLGVDDLGDALDQLALLDLIGDLGDDDAVLAARQFLLLPLGAQAEGAAAGLVGLDDQFARLDQQAAGREVRAFHEIDQGLDARVGRPDQMQQRIAELAGVVRRDRAGHADGDAGRAIGQQVRKAAGQDDRLLGRAVVVGPEVDGVLVDAGQQGLGDLGQPRFGVAHGGGVIAVDIAEIALPFDQGIAGGEILGEPHQRVIDRLVAVRVILADHVADDTGAFLEGAVGVEPQLAHGIEQAAMHRLQAVAHVRQGARHDGRQRIGQIPLAERLSELHRPDRGQRNDVVAFCHLPGLRGRDAVRATSLLF